MIKATAQPPLADMRLVLIGRRWPAPDEIISGWFIETFEDLSLTRTSPPPVLALSVGADDIFDKVLTRRPTIESPHAG